MANPRKKMKISNDKKEITNEREEKEAEKKLKSRETKWRKNYPIQKINLDEKLKEEKSTRKLLSVITGRWSTHD